MSKADIISIAQVDLVNAIGAKGKSYTCFEARDDLVEMMEVDFDKRLIKLRHRFLGSIGIPFESVRHFKIRD